MRPFTSLVLFGMLALTSSSSLSAQLRSGGGQSRSSGISSWWFSGGTVVAGLGPVNDGRTGSTWDFAGDPRWQLRGTLEKAMNPTTTLGIAVNYGNVDFEYRPLAGAPVPDVSLEAPASVAVCQVTGCQAQVNLMGLQAVLRGGGAREGLYQIIEASAGVIGFQQFTAKSDGAQLPVERAIDLTGGLGYGFGFALSGDAHIAFVQDFGIAWHSGESLPEGTGRTYRTRNTRITLRYGLGSFSR